MPGSEVVHQLDLDPELPEDVLAISIQQGEDPETKGAIVKQFREMIFERGECCPPTTDDDFLIKFLRARFWKVENSYKLLCRYCNFREENRDYYEKVHPLELTMMGDDDIITVTPYRDQNGRRIIIYRFGRWDPSTVSVADLFKATMLLFEVGSMEPRAQVLGGVGIMDLSGLSLSHILQLTPSVAQKIIALMVTSMPMRPTAVHVVFQNWLFNAGFQIFKPFLHPRMREKIFIHGSDMTSLHKYINPEHLPERYGGIHPDFSYKIWFENLSKQDKIKIQLEQLGYVVEDRELPENWTSS